ncbi:TetR/AcrR family transcriptional regulator [Jiangella alba]|uniref:DNA-binding transcriptional regulator, AcrR family n=1 Tax=Jiangella alba TaxID=561176 RepID=A0A1H5PWN6_9ACTN|nr:TetR/AcrR family transcriptional regulator [Jiangella alba]SEF18272.1 DNA-binding transcriptional regulator, AcrR family [Jiangella alba]
MPVRRSAEARLELRASLLDHARRLIERDGAAALTMRALAAEAGCAVGLPYKVFGGREDIAAELVGTEFRRLRHEFDAWVATAGTGTVGENLARYARLFIEADTPVFRLVGEGGDTAFDSAVGTVAESSGLLESFGSTVADYLAAEKRLGRVAADVDEHAFGFVVTGAVHNLASAGDGYPRPALDTIERYLHAVAARIVT